VSKLRIPKRAAHAGRPTGAFTQFRRLEGMRELLEERPTGVTIEELAGALRVSSRSVRRYLEELREELTLESVRVRPGGPQVWRVAPGEKGRAISLRRTQAYLLHAARATFEPMRGSAVFDEVELALRDLLLLAARPLKSKQGMDVRSPESFGKRLVFTQPPARGYSARSAELDDLFRAVAELREISVTYRPAGADRPEIQTVQALAIVVDRGEIRVLAREDERSAAGVRVLELERIESTTLLPTRFAVPDGFEAGAHLHPLCGVLASPDPRRAIVEIDASLAPSLRARKLHPAQRIANAADGRMRLSLPVGELGAMARWILSMGGAARAVEPLDLVALVRRLADAARNRH
jgi:hypothetical protein